MKKVIVVVLVLTIMTAVAYGDTINNGRTCDSIAGSGPIYQAGTIVLLGEIHGTNEAPAIVARLVCNALNSGLAVSVGLEIPISEEAAVNKFLTSDGTAEDYQAMIAGEFWQRDYQDGRSSRAMAQLISDIREIQKKAGDSVHLVLLDDPTSELGRDRFMAGRIVDEIKQYPTRLFVSLTGNIHSQIYENNGFGFAPMGYHITQLLPKTNVISLELTHAGGTAWVCPADADCGAMRLAGDDDSMICQLFDDESVSPRTGVLSLGPITASPPAKISD